MNEIKNPGKWAGRVQLAGRITYEAPQNGERLGHIRIDGTVVAQGETKDAAFAKFIDIVASELEGHYTPEVILFGKDMALIWREPLVGWLYTVKPAHAFSTITNIHRAASKDEAQEAARTCLAQIALDAGNDIESAALVFENEDERLRYMRKYRQQVAIAKIMERENCSIEIAQEHFQDMLLDAFLKQQ